MTFPPVSSCHPLQEAHGFVIGNGEFPSLDEMEQEHEVALLLAGMKSPFLDQVLEKPSS